MNLYLFNATDSAAIYGIGSYLRELTQALDGAGINIHIVHLHSLRTEFEISCSTTLNIHSSTTLTNRAIRKNSLPNRVENWYVPEVRNYSTFSGSVQKLEDYYHNVVYLLQLHIKDTTDLVFHFNYNQSYCLAKELKNVFDCKTVSTVHFMKWSQELLGNLSMFHTMKEKPENQRNAYEQLLIDTDEYESALYNETDRVIALSQNMKDFLCSEYQLNPNKIVVIPNGMDDINATPEISRDDLRRKWHISEKESVIIFAGRLQPIKGLVFLIRAFRNVLEVLPDCRLIIAGNGNYDPFFQEAKETGTKVTFTGFLEKQDLHELYQIADAGIVPSLYEPFGYVAVEMMMHCLPVVATTTSGLNEVVDDTCGLKVPVTELADRMDIDTSLLAEKILYLLHHPAEAQRMGHNGRKRYLKEYASKAFRKNMLKFYQSLNN